MTIKDCIDIVDNIKPNQYTIKDKVMWLSFIEEIIINEVLKTHEGYDGRYDDFEGYSENKLSVRLIVPSPYDRLYTEYLKMMIDKENGEVARYNNSMTSYNSYMSEYRKHYNKTHMPISAISRKKIMPVLKGNVGLSEAEYENLKKDMTYILTEYFSDSLSEAKITEVVNNFVLNNIAMLKGKDGRDGRDGKDGYTPRKGIDYFDGEKGKAFTYADFTPQQLEALKGPKGDKGDRGDQGARGLKGDRGDPGYTPQKGVDYFTSSEVAQFERSSNKVTELNKNSGHNQYPSAKAVWDLIFSTPIARTVKINLIAVNWVKVGDNQYSQRVSIADITPYSKIDLQPTVEQLAIFYEKDIAFVTENDGGNVTVYCIGQKPSSDYEMHATITEVTKGE